MTAVDVTSVDDANKVYVEGDGAPGVTWGDIKAWLARHGAPTTHIRSIAFVPEGVSCSGDAPVQLRVESLAVNSDGGHCFAVRGEDGVTKPAVNVTWVPLFDLP